jgi:hypothetical protein
LQDSYLEKLFTKIGLVEWLKVNALSLRPSTEKKKSKKSMWGEGVAQVVGHLPSK